ncbi:hypothetical protein [Desulforamulus ferrireducens]|nr:hypothetical protein [Desulforamulus ferrireducens]
MYNCCVCGRPTDESKMYYDEEMDISYCPNCYLQENSSEDDY